MSASEYARMEISKEDPFRLRFGELIGADWAEVEDGFFEYAIKDAIVTLRAFRPMLLEAQRLMVGPGCDGPGSRRGARAVRRALGVNPGKGRRSRWPGSSDTGCTWTSTASGPPRTALRAGLEAAVADLQAICPGLFKTAQDPATGETSSRTPRRGTLDLRGRPPARLARDRRGPRDHRPADRIPTTGKTGKLQTSGKVVGGARRSHPFVEKWLAVRTSPSSASSSRRCASRSSTRIIATLAPHRADACSVRTSSRSRARASSARRLCPRRATYCWRSTSRSSSCGPSRPICLKVYGRLRAGRRHPRRRDPHAHTAAMIVGVPYEEFLGWKDDGTVIELNGKTQARKHHFKEARQLAKPINFGVPGGLGAASLVAYARHTYKVDMTLEQAGEFRTRLIEEIYPELSIYLDEDGMSLLAHNLGRPVGELSGVPSIARGPGPGTSPWGSGTSSAAGP